MKFCDRPWRYWWLVSGYGDVISCPWYTDQTLRLGNILEQSVEEIMSSDITKSIQESILDGSFRYCDPQLCTFMGNDSLPDLSKEEIDEIVANITLDQFNIAYDDTCNHACPSCRTKLFCPEEGYYEKVDAISEKMIPYYNNAKMISVNGRGEVFASVHLLDMLSKVDPKNDELDIIIETNGALFDRTHWEKIQHLGKYNVSVMVTIQSFNDIVYRSLSGYANHVDKLIDNLHFMSELRQAGIINHLETSMIVQESNFRELPEFVNRCLNEFSVDKVRVRGILQFSMDATEYWYKDVFNPAHPFYKEAMDMLQHPIMKDSRVWFWEGDYSTSRKPIPHALQRKADKYKAYYDFICGYELCEDKEKLHELWREKLASQTVALYGIGEVGKMMIQWFEDASININKIIDKKGQKCSQYRDIIIEKLTEINDWSDVDVVIVSALFDYDTITCELRRYGYEGDIYSAIDLLDM